jgi:hypothetical protein
VERTGPGSSLQMEVEGNVVPGKLIPLPPPGVREVHVRTKVF